MVLCMSTNRIDHPVMATIPSPRTDASAVIARDPNVTLAFTTLGQAWLINRGPEVDISPGELCGFNTGSFAEIPSGPN